MRGVSGIDGGGVVVDGETLEVRVVGNEGGGVRQMLVRGRFDGAWDRGLRPVSPEEWHELDEKGRVCALGY